MPSAITSSQPPRAHPRLVPSLSGIKFIKVFKLRRITPAFRQKGWANWTPFTLVGSWEIGLREIFECLSKVCTTLRLSRSSRTHSCPRFGLLPFVSATDGNGVVRDVSSTLPDAEQLNFIVSSLCFFSCGEQVNEHSRVSKQTALTHVSELMNPVGRTVHCSRQKNSYPPSIRTLASQEHCASQEPRAQPSGVTSCCGLCDPLLFGYIRLNGGAPWLPWATRKDVIKTKDHIPRE